MKRARMVCLSAVLLAAFALSFAIPASAQQGAAAELVRIRKIEPSTKVPTPEYKLLTGQVMAQTRNWFQLNVTYDTAPAWMDDLTFTYYILTQAKTPPAKLTLFRGEVTYVNIEKGKHKSDIYLHPSTIARYGEVQQVAVVISSQGRVLAMESLPASAKRWWEQLTPLDGYALNRMQTPFAMINFDDYEQVKPSAAGGR